MDNQTRKIRAQKWAEIAIACSRRGQVKTAWCEEHEVKLKSFYYWQSRLHKHAAAGMDGLCPGGALNAFQQALSRELRRAYIDYFNCLHMRCPSTGEVLTRGADGRSGSVKTKSGSAR